MAKNNLSKTLCRYPVAEKNSNSYVSEIFIELHKILLSKSELIRFSLIESVETIFFTVKSVNPKLSNKSTQFHHKVF